MKNRVPINLSTPDGKGSLLNETVIVVEDAIGREQNKSDVSIKGKIKSLALREEGMVKMGIHRHRGIPEETGGVELYEGQD